MQPRNLGFHFRQAELQNNVKIDLVVWGPSSIDLPLQR